MDCVGLDRLLVLLRSPPLRHVDLEAGGDGGVPQDAVPSHTDDSQTVLSPSHLPPPVVQHHRLHGLRSHRHRHRIDTENSHRASLSSHTYQ